VTEDFNVRQDGGKAASGLRPALQLPELDRGDSTEQRSQGFGGEHLEFSQHCARVH
jgi:hypothetical protein